MLTYSRTRLVFLIASALAVLEYFLISFPWYYLLQIPILYFVIVGYGSATISAGFFLKSICSIDTKEKVLALTFDDGPDPLKTPQILEILRLHNIKATFFVIGGKIKGSEELLKQIEREGHLIANHSFSHSYFFDFYSTSKVIDDLALANRTIQEVIGKTPKLFRPPYGVTNPNIAKALKTSGLISIGWNVRSLDTVIQNADKLYKRVISRIKPGSILLFHDTGSHTIETLKAVILFAEKNSYKTERLDQLLSIKAYEEN
ncbi:MAG TPA: polysaccharide deacetylase family protein [Cytophagaceae bacterium]|nr:polysaccharide deacetylase family protein [Cytophagaceae bacterium]